MRNQSGAIRLSTIIWFGLLASLVYAVIKLAPPYINNFQISNTVKTAAKFYADKAKRNSVEVYLDRKVKDMDLPVRPADFTIEETSDGYVRVSIDWQTDVVWIPENSFVPAYVQTLTFYHEATEKLK
jgi:hypothetical protein